MKTTLIETFDVSVEELYETVTNLKEYEWRSDLSKIHLIDGFRKFQEISKKGIVTDCLLTECEPNKCYALKKTNKNTSETCRMSFGFDKMGKTVIIIEDELIVLNPVKRILSAGLFDNEKSIKAYLYDLKKRFK